MRDWIEFFKSNYLEVLFVVLMTFYSMFFIGVLSRDSKEAAATALAFFAFYGALNFWDWILLTTQDEPQ